MRKKNWNTFLNLTIGKSKNSIALVSSWMTCLQLDGCLSELDFCGNWLLGKDLVAVLIIDNCVGALDALAISSVGFWLLTMNCEESEMLLVAAAAASCFSLSLSLTRIFLAFSASSRSTKRARHVS